MVPPVLRLPRHELLYSVDTDACKYQIGCALLQTYPSGTRHLIGFWSRSLSPAERNYSSGERECLAVVRAVQILRPFLERRHFPLFTDHQALKWIMYLAKSNGRLARWCLRLLDFDFEVFYRKGAKNTIADSISRLPAWGYLDVSTDLDIPCFLIRNLTGPLPIQRQCDTSSWVLNKWAPDSDPGIPSEVLAVDAAPLTEEISPLIIEEIQVAQGSDTQFQPEKMLYSCFEWACLTRQRTT